MNNRLGIKTKFVTRQYFDRLQRIKLIQIILPNGNKYWIRPFQLQLIEKDLKYMEKMFSMTLPSDGLEKYEHLIVNPECIACPNFWKMGYECCFDCKKIKNNMELHAQ